MNTLEVGEDVGVSKKVAALCFGHQRSIMRWLSRSESMMVSKRQPVSTLIF